MNIASLKRTKALRFAFCWGCVSLALFTADIATAQTRLPTLPTNSKTTSTATPRSSGSSYVVVSYPDDGNSGTKPAQKRVFKKLRKLPSSEYKNIQPATGSRKSSVTKAPLAPAVYHSSSTSVVTAGQPITVGKVVPASCSSCSSGIASIGRGSHVSGGYCGGCPTGCCPGVDCEPGAACCSTQCGQCCVPGRTKCCAYCVGKGPVSKLLCGLYYATQCPDPCYEPKWNPIANAGMFMVADARPISHMRVRYDGMFNVEHPDRNEYLMQRQDGAGRNTRTADIHEFRLYNEIAVGGFGFFVDVPFRSVEFNPSEQSGSGYTDMMIGTKSMLLDSELLVTTFQFTTYIPSGVGPRGLGTRHVSLEPALLFSLKLTPDMYMQYESALWIPIGADAKYGGNIWHNHVSFNTVLYRFLTDSALIGTLEGVTYHVFDGAYTNVADAAVSHDTTIFNAGGSIRWHWGERMDLGVGLLFAITGSRFAQEQLRFELRRRF